MVTKAASVLEPRQLNDADQEVLNELHEGRASPSYLAEQTGIEQTYINQRLRRLDEHGHVENLARGLWELVDDPREDATAGVEDLHGDELREEVVRLREALERVDRDTVEDALSRIEELLEVDDAA